MIVGGDLKKTKTMLVGVQYSLEWDWKGCGARWGTPLKPCHVS